MTTILENNETENQKWQLDDHRLVSYRNCKYFTLVCFIIFVFCSVLVQIDLINVTQDAEDFKKERNIINHDSLIDLKQMQQDRMYLRNHRIRLRKLQMEELKFPIQNQTQNANSTYPNLQQASPSPQSSQSATHTKIYMILLIVGLCLLLTGGLIILGVVVYRHFINPQQAPAIVRSNQVANGSKMQLNTIMIAPPIPYTIFVKQIGEPLHDSCVICLESFGCQNQLTDTNKNEYVGIQSIDKNKQKQNKLDKNMVSLTVCGHLLHEQCLKQWIGRQPNCPLCRQQFSDENLTQWETKIGIDFSYIYDIFQKQAKGQKKESIASIPNRFKSSNKITNISRICKYQNKKITTKSSNTNRDSGASNYSNTRDSIQLHWVRIYNNRKVINKQRHNKYNMYTVLKQISDNNKGVNDRVLTKITNENAIESMDVRHFDHGYKEQSRCSMMGNRLKIHKKQKQCGCFSVRQLYALMVYSAIMDYHEGRHYHSDDTNGNDEKVGQMENALKQGDNKFNINKQNTQTENKEDKQQGQYAQSNSSNSQEQNQQQEQHTASILFQANDDINKANKAQQRAIIQEQASEAYIRSQCHVKSKAQDQNNNQNMQSNKQNIQTIHTNTNADADSRKGCVLVRQQVKAKVSRASTPFTQQLQHLQSLIYPNYVGVDELAAITDSLY